MLSRQKINKIKEICLTQPIGFLIVNTNISVSPWIKGLLIGLLLSLPDAIITKTYAPILGIGIIGGIVIGFFVGK